MTNMFDKISGLQICMHVNIDKVLKQDDIDELSDRKSLEMSLF